jgi:PAS domain S-box-containing protein
MQSASKADIDLYHLLVENITDYAIFLLDPEGCIRSWGEGALRIEGYTASEVLGRHLSLFYPPAAVQAGKPAEALRVAAAEGRWEEEGWRVRKDGSYFWASAVITALYDANGMLVGFAKVVQDLTERKRAEDERARLLERERQARTEAEAALAQLRALQSVTEAALAHLQLDDLVQVLLERIGALLSADMVALLLLTDDGQHLVPLVAKGLDGEPQDELRIPLGQGFAGRIAAERRPLVLEDASRTELMGLLLRPPSICSLMGAPLLVEGRTIGVLQVGTHSARRFTEADSQFLQVVADRVALALDHARLYEAAQQARREAEAAGFAVRLRDEFLAVAAHELKTPVTSLRGLSELLLRRLDSPAASEVPRFRRILQLIQRQTLNLTRLVNQLLEVTWLDAGRLPLQRRPEDVRELVRQAVEEAQALTDHHELVLVAPDAIYAELDGIRFQQVVTNLLDNAIKYSPGGGRIDVTLEQPAPDRLRLAVRDRGIGVPRGHEARVFERYYQAHARSHQSGLGLGLYVSQQLIEQHGGRLWFERPADGGSRFVLELPIGSKVGTA